MGKLSKDRVRRVPAWLFNERSPWMTTAAAAEYLGFTSRTLRRWRAAGAGPVYYPRRRFVRRQVAELDAFIRRRSSAEIQREGKQRL
jgi:hypothetical protein